MSDTHPAPDVAEEDARGAKRARIDGGVGDAMYSTSSITADGSAAALGMDPTLLSMLLPPEDGSGSGAAASASLLPSSSLSFSPSQSTAPLITPQPPTWIGEVPSFLESMQQHQPTIPDEVVQYLLEKSGCNITDTKLIRLVAIATQHFLSEVMTDARYFQKLRSKDANNSELTLNDLSSALQNNGINIAKPEFIADNVFAGGLVNVSAAIAPATINLHGSLAKDAKKEKDKEKDKDKEAAKKK